MNFKDIVEAFEDCDYNPRSYSGRCMYGKKCLGVVDDSPQNVAMNVLSEFIRCNDNISDIQDLCEALKNSRQDSMGLSSIVYFPDLKWEDVDDGSEDDLNDGAEDDDDLEELPE